MTIGKICHRLYECDMNTEHVFKQEAIAKLTDNYLKEILTKREYNSLKEINIDIHYSNYDNVSLGTTLKGISCEINGRTGLASKTLKVINFILNDIGNGNIDSIETRIEKTSIYSSLSSSELDKIYSKPLNRTMKKCLSKPYYRHKDNSFPSSKSSSYDLYSFKNDTFFINDKNQNLIALQNISYLIKTEKLGCLYFDTDSSFIHFNRYNPYNFDKPTKISKKHFIIDSIPTGHLELSEEDILNNRILIYYYSQPNNRTDSIGNYPNFLFGMKKKFMYLIDQDYLIPDYQELEQKIIEDYLNKSSR